MLRNYALLLAFGLLLSCAAAPPPPAPRPAGPRGAPKPYVVDGKIYRPLPHARNFKQRGIASWYGKKFHGRKTSSGEVYDMHAMTAAHKTLPLGTYVRVRHLKNNKMITVRINDRGPFVRNRIIDLSYTGAQKLGIVGPGTGPVEVVALGAAAQPNTATTGPQTFVPLDYESGRFTIQVGAFKIRANAENYARRLKRRYKNVHVKVVNDGRETYYKVRIGRVTSLTKAVAYEQQLIQHGFRDAFAVAE